jgi:hypothetical protein
VQCAQSKRSLNELSHTSPSVIVLIGLIGAYALTALGVLPIMVGNWVVYLEISEHTAGFIASSTIAGLTSGQLLAVTVFAGRPSVKLAGWGIVISLVFDGLSILADGPVLLGGLRFGAGLGYGLALIAVMSWFGRHENADRCFGVVMLLQVLIFAPLLVLVPILENTLGSATPYLCLLVLGSFSLLVRPLLNLNSGGSSGHNEKGDRAAATALSRRGTAARAVQRNITLRIAAVAAPTIFLVGVMGIWAYLARYGDFLRIGKEHIGSVLGAVTLIGIPASLLVIWSGNRFGRLLPVTLGILAVFLPLAAFYLGFETFVVYVVAAAAFTFGWSYGFPYMQAVQADLDPTGRLVAIAMIPQGLGSAIGPAAFAIAMGIGGYPAGFLLVMILLASSMAVILPPVFACREAREMRPLR